MLGRRVVVPGARGADRVAGAQHHRDRLRPGRGRAAGRGHRLLRLSRPRRRRSPGSAGSRRRASRRSWRSAPTWSWRRRRATTRSTCRSSPRSGCRSTSSGRSTSRRCSSRSSGSARCSGGRRSPGRTWPRCAGRPTRSRGPWRACPAPASSTSCGRTRLIAPGRGTLITELLERAGGESVTGGEPLPYPRLSLETVVERRPERIIVGRHGQATAAELLRGWEQLTGRRRRSRGSRLRGGRRPGAPAGPPDDRGAARAGSRPPSGARAVISRRRVGVASAVVLGGSGRRRPPRARHRARARSARPTSPRRSSAGRARSWRPRSCWS